MPAHRSNPIDLAAFVATQAVVIVLIRTASTHPQTLTAATAAPAAVRDLLSAF